MIHRVVIGDKNRPSLKAVLLEDRILGDFTSESSGESVRHVSVRIDVRGSDETQL